jgi:hypothetical protein
MILHELASSDTRQPFGLNCQINRSATMSIVMSCIIQQLKSESCLEHANRSKYARQARVRIYPSNAESRSRGPKGLSKMQVQKSFGRSKNNVAFGGMYRHLRVIRPAPWTSSEGRNEAER